MMDLDEDAKLLDVEPDVDGTSALNFVSYRPIKYRE